LNNKKKGSKKQQKKKQKINMSEKAKDAAFGKGLRLAGNGHEKTN